MKWIPLKVDMRRARYQALVGVGGIGAGTFFALDGNHTLGREESRSGHFLDQRDYCKLHIIAHYIQTLLGSHFHAFPVGKVGADETGQRLLLEMLQVGLDVRYVQATPGEQTLNAICLIYPDGTGGNLTPDDSANSRVDAAYVSRAEPAFAQYRHKGIALAAPEVSLEARRQLLQLGTRYDFYRVLSLTSGEASSSQAASLLEQVDFLALNLEEAAALVVMESTLPPQVIVEAAIERLSSLLSKPSLSVTAGKRGCWTWDGKDLSFYPAIAVETASSAGAGDAHLAGLLCGLTVGLSLAHAQELATLAAALSVTSKHTIHPSIDRTSLRDLASQIDVRLSSPVRALLEK